MRWLRWLLVLGLLGLLAVGTAARWAWTRIHKPHGAQTTQEFAVESGQSATSILRALESDGLIGSANLARLYLVHVLEDPPLQAGDYEIELPASTPEVLTKLIDGDVVLESVTVIEGLTAEETIDLLAAAGFGDRDRFLELVADPSSISDLDPEASNLEGYLLPETYSFPRSATEEDVIGTMVATFRRQVTPILEAQETAWNLRELVTLASIIEKEAQLDSERPIISGVYTNRLERGIALYADPTVIFALKLAGTWDGNIRKRDLSIDSPYNTYRYAGLPPGPIASAGLASIRAAAAPADVEYLYFVSRNDGSHVFARTLSEHNRNVDEWQRRYWRQRR